MSNNQLFGETDDSDDFQAGLGFDDGSGLRVVNARFLDEQKFSWDIFEGYDYLRVLTYSASTNAIVRMLDRYSFTSFECVFGFEGVLRDIKDILGFQKFVVGNTRAAIMGLKDERHVHILQKAHEGKIHFYVLRKYIAHAKLYLLSRKNGETRILVGSANLSERAFSGSQPETLVKFDNDNKAWQHYSRMFEQLRDSACDEIPLPEKRILNAEIEVSETPVLNDSTTTIVIDTPPPEIVELSAPVQVSRVEKIVAAFAPRISASIPVARGGKQKITPEIKREISRIRLIKTSEEVDNRYFTLDRVNRTALLSGKQFYLDWQREKVNTDAMLILNHFTNYEGAFEGDVPRLQRDYFTFMSWLYFSPLMCDMRSLALVQDSDVIRFPLFAILFGKSNCGKTCLVDTLTTSMFGFAPIIEKQSFTSAKLLGLQQAYKRLPVVFDDIGRVAFRNHGRDIIKNEMQPPVSEYPSFVVSMNAEPQSFPDEIMKRCLMIYTNTALPQHNEALRQQLESKVEKLRHSLTGHLYRCYLGKILERLDEERLPEDWMALSSDILSKIILEHTGQRPDWCRQFTWLEYAEKRYDRVKARLDNLLRPSAYARNEGQLSNGWKIEGSKVIVWEQRDVFGRLEFEWDDVPSTLIDEEASGGNRTVLHKAGLEKFLGRHLAEPGNWWKMWKRS
jgi:hypothetical protein